MGSADIIGNPLSLFNNVSTGITDFFYEPLLGFELMNVQGVGKGLAKGTASLVKNTVYGVSDTFSRMTGSMSKGLAAATLDNTFQEKRLAVKNKSRPRHAIGGLSQGTASFAEGVVSGITGIISKPIEGAEKEGLGGFLKGFGKGIVGAVTKPVVGIFDLASNISEGIKNTTKGSEMELERQRYPRYIPSDGELLVSIVH